MPPAGTSDQPRRRARAADAPSLDRSAILAAALELVDEQGAGALSMRKLGARLGVEAMTLYYYIPNKAALMEGLAEVVLDELQLPPGRVDDWQSAVREAARSFRRLGLAHPNAFPLLATIGLDNPASYRPLEAILRMLRAAGFGPELAFTAFFSVKSYVVGHVLWILGDGMVGLAERTVPPASVPSEAFPALASQIPYLEACDPEAEFERGLNVLVAGLEVLKARP